MDDVAFTEDWHGQDSKEPCGQTRSEKLQGKGNLVENDYRNWDHQKKDDPGKQKSAKTAPTRKIDNQSCQEKHEGRWRQNELRAAHAGNKPNGRTANHFEPRPAGRWRELREPLSLLPK